MSKAKCPTEYEWAAYNVGHVADAHRLDLLDEHLERCPNCQSALLTLCGAEDTLVSKLRKAAPKDEFANESMCREALGRVAAYGRDLTQSPGGNQPATGTQPAAEHAEPLGQIRDYRLLARLGEGGMGTVYKALHTQLEKIVALKVLASRRLADPQAVDRFKREMRAVGRLDHPNIVRAMDAGEAEGVNFLVMEYIEGIDLSQLVKQLGPLPTADACELVRQAALGLEEAHEHGMVHRDIKPSNLILARIKREPPVVKILDMGLALLSEAHTPDAQALTSTGQLMGTLDYMAPEQGGDSKNVDIRADIFSLGATLYKLLTGVPAFHGPAFETPVQKVLALATRPAPPIQERRPEISDELAAVVHRMLQRLPADRYATPAEVAAALAPFAQGSDLVQLLRSLPETSLPSAPEINPATPQFNGAIATPATQARPLATAAGSASPSAKSSFELSPASSAAGRWRLPGWLSSPIVAAGLVAFLMLAAWIVVATIRTPNGTLVVEVDPKYQDLVEVVASKDGKEVTISKQQGFEIKVHTGEYQLKLKGGDEQLALNQNTVTVTKGKQQVVKVSLRTDDTLPPADVRPFVARPVVAIPVGASPWDQLRRDQIHPGELKIAGGGDPAHAPRDLVAIFGDSRLMHSDAIIDLAYSANGKFIATASRDNTAKLWDAATGECVQTFALQRGVASLAISPNGERLATSSLFDASVYVWNCKSGREEAIFKASPINGRLEVALHAEGNLLVSAGKELILWDIAAGKPVYRQEMIATAVAISPDGKTLAASTPEKPFDIVLLNLASGETLSRLSGHDAAASLLTFRPDGQRLASADLLGKVKVWDLKQGKPHAQFSTDHGTVGLAYSPDGTALATSAYARPATVWDAESGERRFALTTTAGVTPVEVVTAFSPDGQTLATGGANGGVRHWDLQSRTETPPPGGEAALLTAACLTPDGSMLVTARQEGELTLWNIADRQPRSVRVGQKIPVAECLSVSPDGRHLFAAAEIWKLNPLRRVRKLDATKEAGRFAPDSQLLALGKQGLAFYSLASGQLREVTPFEKAVVSPPLDFSPDGRLLAIREPFTNRLALVDVATGKNARQIGDTTVGGIATAAIAPNGKHCAVAHFKQTEVIELATGQARYTCDGATSLAFSPDGTQLALAKENLVSLLQTDQGTRLRQWQLPAGLIVQQILFAPDGRHLIAANANGTVYALRLTPASDG